MKSIERRLPQEIDKSFIVFNEVGTYFPYPWHYHPEYELVMIRRSTGRRMVGDHIGHFDEGDLVFMGPRLPHVWVNDPEFLHGKKEYLADAIVIQFVENFLGQFFMRIPEMENFRPFLNISDRGMVIKGRAREKINALMEEMLPGNGLQRLSSLFSIFDILSRLKKSEYEVLASIGETLNDIYKLYRWLGHADHFQSLIGPGEHDFPPEIRKLSYDFLDQFLKNEKK